MSGYNDVGRAVSQRQSGITATTCFGLDEADSLAVWMEHGLTPLICFAMALACRVEGMAIGE